MRNLSSFIPTRTFLAGQMFFHLPCKTVVVLDAVEWVFEVPISLIALIRVGIGGCRARGVAVLVVLVADRPVTAVHPLGEVAPIVFRGPEQLSAGVFV